MTNGKSDSSHYLWQLFLDDKKTVLVEELTFTVILANVSMTGANIGPYNINLDDNDQNNDNPINMSYLTNILDK